MSQIDNRLLVPIVAPFLVKGLIALIARSDASVKDLTAALTEVRRIKSEAESRLAQMEKVKKSLGPRVLNALNL